MTGCVRSRWTRLPSLAVRWQWQLGRWAFVRPALAFAIGPLAVVSFPLAVVSTLLALATRTPAPMRSEYALVRRLAAFTRIEAVLVIGQLASVRHEPASVRPSIALVLTALQDDPVTRAGVRLRLHFAPFALNLVMDPLRSVKISP
jgi:hypothetical protein